MYKNILIKNKIVCKTLMKPQKAPDVKGGLTNTRKKYEEIESREWRRPRRLQSPSLVRCLVVHEAYEVGIYP